MSKKQRLFGRLEKNKLKIWLFSACYSACASVLSLWTLVVSGKPGSIVFVIGYALMTVCYLYWYMEEKLKKACLDASEKYYLSGLQLSRYFDTDAIRRLELCLRTGFCFELSALAMSLVKDNKTARYCSGNYYDDNGTYITKHAWVEVKTFLAGWYVIDLALGFYTPVKKKEYFRLRKKTGYTLKLDWSVSHDEFWKESFADQIYRSIQVPEMSYDILGAHGSLYQYGFWEWILRNDGKCGVYDQCGFWEWLRNQDQSVNKNKPVDNDIIRSFVLNPNQEKPD